MHHRPKNGPETPILGVPCRPWTRFSTNLPGLPTPTHVNTDVVSGWVGPNVPVVMSPSSFVYADPGLRWMGWSYQLRCRSSWDWDVHHWIACQCWMEIELDERVRVCRGNIPVHSAPMVKKVIARPSWPPRIRVTYGEQEQIKTPSERRTIAI